MTSRDDRNLPPLSEELRRAVSELRTERPSPEQQARIHAALQAAEARRSLSQRSAKKPVRSRRFNPEVWAGLGAALASVLLAVVVERSPGGGATQSIIHEAMPVQEVSFLLPEGGGWVALPLNLDRHPEGAARVHLDTPAELDFHQHSSHLPTVQLVSCDEERCTHQFTAEAGDGAEPLRVRIHRPGDYVFHVSHASDAWHIAESFIVRAAQ